MSVADFPRHPLTFGGQPRPSTETAQSGQVAAAHLGGQPAINAYHRLWH